MSSLQPLINQEVFILKFLFAILIHFPLVNNKIGTNFTKIQIHQVPKMTEKKNVYNNAYSVTNDL